MQLHPVAFAAGFLASNGVIIPRANEGFPEVLTGNYIQVEGRPDKATYVGYVQSFDLRGKKGDVFVVGGWANAKSVPDAGTINRGFAIAMRLKKTDGTWIGYYMLPYNTS